MFRSMKYLIVVAHPDDEVPGGRLTEIKNSFGS